MARHITEKITSTDVGIKLRDLSTDNVDNSQGAGAAIH